MPRNNTVAIPREKRIKAEHTISSPADEARWRLVLAHAPTADFLYGVLSTGIFCRTSCPSRRPRRANARFFDSAASAVAAGFRACRRCRPESTDPSHESPRASAEKQIDVACEYIRRKNGEAQLLDIAAHVGLSPRYLHGLFKQIMGMTPGAYAAGVRQESVSQQSDSVDPAAAVSGSTPHLADIGGSADLTDTALTDGGTSEVSFEDLDWAAYEWVPGTLEDFGCANVDQSPFSEWLDNFDLDTIIPLPGTSGDPIEPQIDIHSLGYVDPTLLDSYMAPS